MSRSISCIIFNGLLSTINLSINGQISVLNSLADLRPSELLRSSLNLRFTTSSGLLQIRQAKQWSILLFWFEWSHIRTVCLAWRRELWISLLFLSDVRLSKLLFLRARLRLLKVEDPYFGEHVAEVLLLFWAVRLYRMRLVFGKAGRFDFNFRLVELIDSFDSLFDFFLSILTVLEVLELLLFASLFILDRWNWDRDCCWLLLALTSIEGAQLGRVAEVCNELTVTDHLSFWRRLLPWFLRTGGSSLVRALHSCQAIDRGWMIEWTLLWSLCLQSIQLNYIVKLSL